MKQDNLWQPGKNDHDDNSSRTISDKNEESNKSN